MITQIDISKVNYTVGMYFNFDNASIKDSLIHLIKYKRRLRSMSKSIQLTRNKYYYVFSEMHHSDGCRMINRIHTLTKFKLAHLMDDLVSNHV